MNARTQALMIDFFNRSFRDVADADYVGARGCHRLNLTQQFLWQPYRPWKNISKVFPARSFPDRPARMRACLSFVRLECLRLGLALKKSMLYREGARA
jgi:hypothetical protein